MSKTSDVYRFGPFRLEISERRLLRDGYEVALRPKVFETLCVLVRNAGHLVTKESLLRSVWPDVVVEENNLNHSVSILRKALGQKTRSEPFIETIPRIGYRFVAPLLAVPCAPANPACAPRPSKTGVRPNRQEIRFCTTLDGVRIAYATIGDGYPLVKAANWLNHLQYEWDSPLWRHWLSELSRDNCFIRYDERSMGLSDWQVPHVTFEDWVRDLEAVVDAFPLKKFVLFGMSQGGSVAISYAVRHPERVSHLILCGAFARGWEHRGLPKDSEGRRALRTLLRLDWGGNNPAFSSLFTNLFIPEDARPEQQNWFRDLQRISASSENAARIMEVSHSINVRSLLPKVTVPTLVFHAERDQVVPMEEGRILAAEIPGARFVPLPTANHILLDDEPAWPRFLAELRSFLPRQTSISA